MSVYWAAPVPCGEQLPQNKTYIKSKSLHCYASHSPDGAHQRGWPFNRKNHPRHVHSAAELMPQSVLGLVLTCSDGHGDWLKSLSRIAASLAVIFCLNSFITG